VARTKEAGVGERVYLRLSARVIAYLGELAKLGVHGDNPTEVAETLVRREIERLLHDDFFLKAQRQLPRRPGRR
jgi:hypothetical protein